MNDNDIFLEGLSERQIRGVEHLVELLRHYNSKPHLHAQYLVKSALGALKVAIGPTTLKEAYGSVPPVSERSEHLSLLAARLRLVCDLFTPADPMESIGSLAAAAEEIEAIANGDAPRLFERLPVEPNSSKSPSAFKRELAASKVFYWEAFFSARGIRTGVYQGWISEAFSGYSFDTIRKWKPGIVQSLGQDRFDGLLEIARIDAESPLCSNIDEQKERLKRDGAKWRQVR